MKKWLWLILAAAALAVLSRLPHPAQDIAKLDPVQAVYIDMEGDFYRIRTDTGDQGRGESLTEAETQLRANASGEVYLETAEYLILDPDVPITEELFAILHPDCRVCFSEEEPDLPAAAEYLSVHKPDLRLAHLRTE